ncbi:MAG TPA: hypothetical protein VNX21_00995 [Candidatus Thermoplasmatota archaeon]|nr:hypothetical protein [Candidatus Thermoplasmatota archaeon]
MALDEGTSILILSGLKLVTVALGFVIVYLGAKAWRSTRRKPLLWLTVGMAIMTLGAISEGAAFQGLRWSLAESHVFEAVVTLVAFAVLVYSLYR